jgi:hypothetical protein
MSTLRDGKVKLFLYRPWKYEGRGVVSLLILNLDTRWKWVSSFTLWQFYRREWRPSHIEQETGWAVRSVWMIWRRETSLTHDGNPSIIHLLCSCLLSHNTDWSIPALTKGSKNYFSHQPLQSPIGSERVQRSFDVRTAATQRYSGNKT